MSQPSELPNRRLGVNVRIARRSAIATIDACLARKPHHFFVVPFANDDRLRPVKRFDAKCFSKALVMTSLPILGLL
jgi:hypothetical protein